MSKSKRAKACDISMDTKIKVFERDRGRCVVCGNNHNVMPNAHYIPRSKGGLGIEQNIVTLCTNFTDNKCHYKFDFGSAEERQDIGAIKDLQSLGHDVAIRLSPLIEDKMDFDRLNGLGINNAVVEFLRVNTWIKRWMPADYSKYSLRSGGYQHLPLSEKIRILEKIKIENVTVCEDVPAHYKYWRENVNPDKTDCCNLRKG